MCQVNISSGLDVSWLQSPNQRLAYRLTYTCSKDYVHSVLFWPACPFRGLVLVYYYTGICDVTVTKWNFKIGLVLPFKIAGQEKTVYRNVCSQPKSTYQIFPFQDKLHHYKSQLEELQSGTLPEYTKKLKRLEGTKSPTDHEGPQ